MTTIKEYCDKNNFICLSTDIEQQLVNNKNKSILKYVLTCGHEKETKVSTLASKKYIVTCFDCKNEDKYNYNIKKKSRYCPTCEFTHTNVPYSNLKSWKCCFCRIDRKVLKTEVKLYRELLTLKLDVSKNFKFPDQKTADLYITNDKGTYIIEVDDKSHLIKKNKESHYEKDNQVLNLPNTQLIRFHKEDYQAFIDNINIVIDNVQKSKNKITVFKNSLATDQFYAKIYDDSNVNVHFLDLRPEELYIPRAILKDFNDNHNDSD